MIKRYDERMLRLLIDKYERSLLYTGDNRRKQTIAVSIDRRHFPEYYDEASQEYLVLHEQLEELESRELIHLKWKNGKQGHILEKCILETSAADKIYQKLHRTPRADRESELLSICREWTGRGKGLDVFLGWIQERIEEGKSIRKYAEDGDPEAFQRLCRLIAGIEQNEHECFLREFSVRFYHDSKEAEKEIRTAAGILRDFSEDEYFRSLSWEEILQAYNIYKNPGYVYLKGKAHIYLGKNDHTGIRCRELKGGIGISGEDIGCLRWSGETVPEKIVTIENLTSFHRWNREDTLAIYLGGYHNTVRREFLMRLFEAYGGKAEFLHFGDIDAGGFKIWKDLVEKTGIPFRTCLMDQSVYEEYLSYGKPLTEEDYKELLRMEADPFFAGQVELFRMMREKNRKLEQEIVRLGK